MTENFKKLNAQKESLLMENTRLIKRIQLLEARLNQQKNVSKTDAQTQTQTQSSPSPQKIDEKGVHFSLNAQKSTVSNVGTASPVQTVTGKNKSNPLMAVTLPKNEDEGCSSSKNKLTRSDLKLENILLLSTINATKDPIRSGTTPILERPEGNPNGGVTMNIIEKKLKQRARRAAARISGRRSSMGGVGGTPKPNRSLDGIDLRCKFVDFGNACWADKQFAQEIQTRQYRSPEVILQSGYSFSADMWSFACIAFGEMMFTPKGGEGFSEDEQRVNQHQQAQLTGRTNQPVLVPGAAANPNAAGNSRSSQSQLPWRRMSRSDYQKYSKVFMAVDTDRDGKITGQEARNLFLSWKLSRGVICLPP
ncbi:SRSF protein kinase 2 [Capsicum chinense]|nr:SRSF protein kinase 2 [Capsicum chinense]